MTTEQHTSPPPASPPAAPSNGLSIAALILAILAAPVGLILGLVARSQAKKEGLRPSGMTTAAIIVGAVLTALSVISAVAVTIFTFVIAGSVNQAAERAEFCGIVAANQADLTYVGATYWSDLDYGIAASAAGNLVPVADELHAASFDDRTEQLTNGLAEDFNMILTDLDAGTPDSLSWPTASSAAAVLVDPVDGPCAG